MPTYQKTYPFKRGDTFAATCTYKQAGVAVPITTQEIKSQLRTESGKLVCDFLVTVNPNQTTYPGQFTLTLANPALTETFPAPADLFCDIQVKQNGSIISTSTFIIPTVMDITR